MDAEAKKEKLRSLPRPQLLKLAQLSVVNPGSSWHFADCGCCVCFHPGGDTSKGWLIGADGDAEYHESHPKISEEDHGFH